jgi:hypothetical protein
VVGAGSVHLFERGTWTVWASGEAFDLALTLREDDEEEAHG